MKLMLDESFSTSYEVELNESTGEKNYIIRGVVSTPNKKNRNGRVYPKNIWEREVQRYLNEDIKGNTYNTLCEWEHPSRSTVDPMKAVAKCRKIWWENDEVMGEFVILNNNSHETNQIKSLIEQGLPIGVSTRGVGRLGKGNIVEEYRWITTDLVANPSNHTSYLRGLMESGFNENLILEDKEFKVLENGDVICDESGCRLEESKEFKEFKECNSKAQELLEALKKFTEKEDTSKLSKYSHLPQDKIDTLFEMGLIEASEYEKLKSQDNEKEREKAKEEKRKEQSENPERVFSKDSKPKDDEDNEDNEDSKPKDDEDDKKEKIK